jgi:hypothetical protein
MVTDTFKLYQISYELKTNTGHIETFHCNIVSNSDSNVKNFLYNRYGELRVNYIRIMNSTPIHSLTSEVVRSIGLQTFNQLQTEFNICQSSKDTPKPMISDINLENPDKTKEMSLKRGLR